MPGALTANGDGFGFLQNAVYEAGMVCLAQGRGLRRDTSQIGCDVACVFWKLVPLPAKETSQLFNAIRQLFVLWTPRKIGASLHRANQIQGSHALSAGGWHGTAWLLRFEPTL